MDIANFPKYLILTRYSKEFQPFPDTDPDDPEESWFFTVPLVSINPLTDYSESRTFTYADRRRFSEVVPRTSLEIELMPYSNIPGQGLWNEADAIKLKKFLAAPFIGLQGSDMERWAPLFENGLRWYVKSFSTSLNASQANTGVRFVLECTEIGVEIR